MPAPKTYRGKTDHFNALQAETDKFDDTNDCVVKMIATCLEIPYEDARTICAEHGRNHGRGMFDHEWQPIFKEFGKRLEYVPARYFLDRYPGVHINMKNITTHQPERFAEVWADGCTYILKSKAHVTAIVDGVNHDWTVGRARRVTSVYRVIDITEEQ